MLRALLVFTALFALACELTSPTPHRSATEVLDDAERSFATMPSLRAKVQGRAGEARWTELLSYDRAAGTRVEHIAGRIGAVKPGFRVWDGKRLLFFDADANSYRYESVPPTVKEPLFDSQLSWHHPERNAHRRKQCAEGTVLADERVAGRATHHLRCGTEELWLDTETGLILRFATPDKTLEIAEIEYRVSFPAATFSTDAPPGAKDEREAARAAPPTVLRSGTPPLEPQELAAIALPKTDLGVPYAAFEREEFGSGYLDNEEFLRLRWPEPLHDAARAALAKCGRVTGHAEAYASPASPGVVFVGTLAHLFTDADGARACLGELASLEERTRGADLAPNVKVLTVDLAPASTIGEEALRLRKSMSWGGAVTTVLFRRGRLVGEAIITRADGQDALGDVTALAQTLDARIKRVLVPASGARKVSAEELITMALTPAQIGGRYAAFTFDWFFGGFWSTPEIVQNAGDPDDERRDIERYSLLVRYLGRYTDPTRPNDAINTSLFLFRDAAGADGYLRDDLADMQRVAQAKVLGTAGIGEKATGYQFTRQNVCTTRILFLRGRLLGQVIVDCAADASNVAAEVARKLDERIRVVLAER